MLYHKILVGSKYFFDTFEDYKSVDIDYVIFDKNPKYYEVYMQKSSNFNEDLFFWDIDEIMNYDYSKTPMALGKFLIPEILQQLELKFSDVVDLIDSGIDKFKVKHNYQKTIFEFYKLNGEPTLTREELELAYQVYKNSKNG